MSVMGPVPVCSSWLRVSTVPSQHECGHTMCPAQTPPPAHLPMPETTGPLRQTPFPCTATLTPYHNHIHAVTCTHSHALTPNPLTYKCSPGHTHMKHVHTATHPLTHLHTLKHFSVLNCIPHNSCSPRTSECDLI